LVLVQLEIQGYDVVLRMDWLARHTVTNLNEKKLITFSTIGAKRQQHRGSNRQRTTSIIKVGADFNNVKEWMSGIPMCHRSIKTIRTQPK